MRAFSETSTMSRTIARAPITTPSHRSSGIAERRDIVTARPQMASGTRVMAICPRPGRNGPAPMGDDRRHSSAARAARENDTGRTKSARLPTPSRPLTYDRSYTTCIAVVANAGIEAVRSGRRPRGPVRIARPARNPSRSAATEVCATSEMVGHRPKSDLSTTGPAITPHVISKPALASHTESSAKRTAGTDLTTRLASIATAASCTREIAGPAVNATENSVADDPGRTGSMR